MCPYIPNSTQNTGFYVPTTNVWDVAQLQDIDVNTPQFKELLLRLYQNVNNISVALNAKDTGYYIDQEFVNGQNYFNPLSTNPILTRSVFRKVIDFGVLPNAGTKTVPHGITVDANLTWTRIYGAATDPVGLNGIPLPYASATGQDIELRVDAVNVIVTTTSNRTAFTRCYIVLEYLKN